MFQSVWQALSFQKISTDARTVDVAVHDAVQVLIWTHSYWFTRQVSERVESGTAAQVDRVVLLVEQGVQGGAHGT